MLPTNALQRPPTIGDIDGFAYIDYIVPGLILMSVISNAYSNCVSSFFSAKFHRSVEEMMISPLPNYIIIAGFVSGGMLRGIVVGIVVTIVSMFFTVGQWRDAALLMINIVFQPVYFYRKLLLCPASAGTDNVCNRWTGFEKKLSVNCALRLCIYFVGLNPSRVHSHLETPLLKVFPYSAAPTFCCIKFLLFLKKIT